MGKLKNIVLLVGTFMLQYCEQVLIFNRPKQWEKIKC